MTKAEAIKIARKKIYAGVQVDACMYFVDSECTYVDVFNDIYQEELKMHCLVAATMKYMCRVFFKEECDDVEVTIIDLEDCSFRKY